MKLPKRFTYMHHNFSVQEGQIVENKMAEESVRPLWGQVRWYEDAILINPDLPEHTFKTTFLHELWHIALDKSGLAVEDGEREVLCDFLAHAVQEMFDSNSWFGAYFHDHS